MGVRPTSFLKVEQNTCLELNPDAYTMLVMESCVSRSNFFAFSILFFLI